MMMHCTMSRMAATLALILWTTRDAGAADMEAILRGLGSPVYAQREAANAELRKVPLEDQEAIMALAARQTDPEIAARLWGRVDEMDMERAEKNAQAPWEKTWPALRGTVVDENGKGVAGASVSASGQLNLGTYWSLVRATQTDASGTFVLHVPYSDVVYHLAAQGPAHAGTYRAVLPEAGIGGPLVTRRQAMPQLLRARLVDKQGKAVAGREVRLLGRKQEIMARSGADGVLSWLADCYSQVTFTTWDASENSDQVVPMRYVQAGERQVDLIMESPGTIKGRVTRKGFDRGIAGVPLTLALNFDESVVHETVTGPGGIYRITGLPAGDYRLTVGGEKYATTTEIGLEQRIPGENPNHVTVTAGAETEMNHEVAALGVLAGRVLDAQGRPAAGAIVVTQAPGAQVFYNWRQTVCDEQGRFWIAAMPRGPEKQSRIEAYSSTGGVAILEIPGLIQGQVQRDIELKLRGAVRLTGVVLNEEGKPLRDVKCGPSAVVTGEDGRFDLGQLAVTKDRPLNVVFEAPRPPRWEGDLGDWKRYQVLSRATAPTFYLHDKRTLDGEAPDRAIRWEVQLKRTPLMEITGRLLDARGLPVAGAKVNLMSGEVDEAGWREVSKNMRGPATGAGGVSLGKGKAACHQWVTTGADGRWTFWYVREDLTTEEGKRWAGPLSLAAMLDTQLSPLRPLTDAEMAGERCEIDLRMEK
jgi:protocatechuate 3,4-dioxygenase beta subunit